MLGLKLIEFWLVECGRVTNSRIRLNRVTSAVSGPTDNRGVYNTRDHVITIPSQVNPFPTYPTLH
jgi:hypothetical protein